MTRECVLALAVVFAGCGGNETVASKSAEAYREAQGKGTTQTADASHDHAAMDHSAHGAAGTVDPHAGHRMAAAQTESDPHAGHRMAEAAQAESDPHAGHRMGAAQAQSDPHAGHRAGATQAQRDPHAGHRMGATQAQSDPHAGHRAAGTQAQSDPHAGHRAAGAAQQPQGDPHAGHRATGAQTQSAADPHAHHAPPPARAAARDAAGTAGGDAGAPRPRGGAPVELEQDAFDAPAATAVAEAAKAAGRAAPEGVYSCPMHPEVVSATPGKCPKCGMDLVKKDSNQ